MIPFDFDYYRPNTINEAIELFFELESKGKSPKYYSGGSEILSMARVNSIQMKSVIDLKAITDCNLLEINGDNLIIGSCNTLSDIAESKLFPLLGQTVSRIADHTMQCKITIGGNICGTILYKEAILPLLLTDCKVVIANKNGTETKLLKDVFKERIQLSKGEFIVQFIINTRFITLPFNHIKVTKNEKIDYPILTISAIKDNQEIKLGISGICSFPFRSEMIEKEINNKEKSKNEKVNNILNLLPGAILKDIFSSDKYRKFVLRNNLMKILKFMEDN